MKYVAFAFILSFNVFCCLSDSSVTTPTSVIIDGSTETDIPNITEISNGTTVSPNSTTVAPNSTTTVPTTPIPPITTTTTPNTTTTTVKPSPPPSPPPTTKIPTTTTTTTTTTVKPTSTTAAPTSNEPSTMKPIDPTTTIPDHQRKFDGPSFVGGIVLALGLVAIGFVAFKFYKARTELNYHTL